MEIDTCLTVKNNCYLFVVSYVSCIGDLLTGEGRQTLEDEHARGRKEGVTWKPFSIRHRTLTFPAIA